MTMLPSPTLCEQDGNASRRTVQQTGDACVLPNVRPTQSNRRSFLQLVWRGY